MSGPGKVVLNWKLKEAAKIGDIHNVECLIQSGAEVNEKASILIMDPKSALHSASENGHLQGMFVYIIRKL